MKKTKKVAMKIIANRDAKKARRKKRTAGMLFMVIMVHKNTVVMKFPRRLADVIIKAQEMLNLINTNSYLPSPVPGIADLKPAF